MVEGGGKKTVFRRPAVRGFGNLIYAYCLLKYTWFFLGSLALAFSCRFSELCLIGFINERSGNYASTAGPWQIFFSQDAGRLVTGAHAGNTSLKKKFRKSRIFFLFRENFLRKSEEPRVVRVCVYPNVYVRFNVLLFAFPLVHATWFFQKKSGDVM